MISQEFTAGALNRLRRRGAQFRYKDDAGSVPKNATEWKDFLLKVQDEILDGGFRFRDFKKKAIAKGKLMFSTSSLENVMVMRKMNDNIRRAYGVKQANRFDTIRQIQQALKETTPKHIIKLDIKSFYESVPRRMLLDKLRADRLVSTRTLELLSRLLKFVSHSGSRGLPRGLQISATLAELHAMQLERDLRAIPGVYYLARYVDDIVLFSYVTHESIKASIESSFDKNRLEINLQKISSATVDCRCAYTCTHEVGVCPCTSVCKCKVLIDPAHVLSVEILGYRIAFPDVNEPISKKRQNDVKTYMADKKIRKYKMRVNEALIDYGKTGDFYLLYDRVLFLTGNYRLESTKVGGSLRGGIFYNFDMYSPYSDVSILSNNRLEHLDEFLSSGLIAVLSAGKKVSNPEKRRLISMSFVRGHAYKRMRALAPKRISEIGACWHEA